MTKHTVKSSTFWFNVVNTLVAGWIYVYHPEWLTPEVTASWLTGGGLSNIALRFKTKTGISLK